MAPASRTNHDFLCSHNRIAIMKDHYAALGLRSSATMPDIKKAFRQQASLHHPDRNVSLDAPMRFRAVQEAYDVLSDPHLRKAYDDNRQRNLLDSPIDTARKIWLDYFDGLLGAGHHPEGMS